jgi:hypothetical protein
MSCGIRLAACDCGSVPMEGLRRGRREVSDWLAQAALVSPWLIT